MTQSGAPTSSVCVSTPFAQSPIPGHAVQSSSRCLSLKAKGDSLLSLSLQPLNPIRAMSRTLNVQTDRPRTLDSRRVSRAWQQATPRVARRAAAITGRRGWVGGGRVVAGSGQPSTSPLPSTPRLARLEAEEALRCWA